MALRLAGIDPGTNGDHCPAVFMDEETGDFLFQGWTVTDPVTLADVARRSPITDSESVVRLPARMRQIILEALSGQAATIQRADRGDTDLSRAPGDEGGATRRLTLSSWRGKRASRHLSIPRGMAWCAPTPRGACASGAPGWSQSR